MNIKNFIKLSKIVINPSKIIKIEMHSDAYLIYMSNTYIKGMYIGFMGSINSHDDYIQILKDKSPEDFDIITKWIFPNQNSNNL